jgi:hypothetical protein
VTQAEAAPTSAPHGTVHEPTGAADSAGTSLSADGLRLDVPVTVLQASQATDWSFRILDAQGEPVRDYDLEQGKQLHLVLVSRDLSRSAHLHPELAPDGTWSTGLTLSPGSYRAVADFTTEGRRRSLGVDLTAPGPLEPSPLPSPVATSQVADLRVELSRDGQRLRFDVSRGNETVVPEPYLGARGHLTAFRAGDLAYAHVHPAGVDGATTSYDAELPGPGTYRLFLELQVDGTVRTFPFTLEVSS